MPIAHPPHPHAAGSAACVYISPSIWRLQIEIISSPVSARPEPRSQPQHLPASLRQPQLDSDKEGSVPWVFDGGRGKAHSASSPPCLGTEGKWMDPPSQLPLGEQSLWLAPGLHTDFQGSGEMQGLPHFRLCFLMAVLTISVIKVLAVQP